MMFILESWQGYARGQECWHRQAAKSCGQHQVIEGATSEVPTRASCRTGRQQPSPFCKARCDMCNQKQTKPGRFQIDTIVQPL